MNEKEVVDFAARMLSDRGSLMSLWQEMADHFYPERASFTYTRYLGDEFADHLISSKPALIRRELGDSFTSMLRPRGKQWFKIVAKDEAVNERHNVRAWLEWASKRMYDELYQRHTQFVRATKEGDHDFATFGQTVINIEPNGSRTHPHFNCHHLRDCAWKENADGMIDTFVRKWRVRATKLYDKFGDRCHDKVIRLAKDPKKKHQEITCYHLVMDSEELQDKDLMRFKYASLWVDADNKHFMEKLSLKRMQYNIPRWQTVSGSQYAFSPATIVALPDARLIQAIALTLLEAGEKYTNPPLIATMDAVKSDIATYAGGVTWVDASYDERLGRALQPISQDKRGYPFGLDIQNDIHSGLMKAFYIDKLGPLPMDKEMTAFEVGQLVQDWVRSALPLFEPMEVDYNGQVCESTFDLMMDMGRFGSPFDIPKDLMGGDYEFKFESPLHEHTGRIQAQQFQETRQYLLEALEIDPDMIAEYDIKEAFRDAVKATGAPTEWLRDPEIAGEMLEGIQKERQAQQMRDEAQQSAEVIKTGAEANNLMGVQ